MPRMFVMCRSSTSISTNCCGRSRELEYVTPLRRSRLRRVGNSNLQRIRGPIARHCLQFASHWSFTYHARWMGKSFKRISKCLRRFWNADWGSHQKWYKLILKSKFEINRFRLIYGVLHGMWNKIQSDSFKNTLYLPRRRRSFCQIGSFFSGLNLRRFEKNSSDLFRRFSK